MDYAEIKLLAEAYLGLHKDALHVHAALALYFFAMFVFRQTHRSRVPWLFVLGVELANELADFAGHQWQIYRGGWEQLPFPWDDSAKDIWNTMLWPTVIVLLSRYTSLFIRQPPAAETEEGKAEEDPDQITTKSPATISGAPASVAICTAEAAPVPSASK